MPTLRTSGRSASKPDRTTERGLLHAQLRSAAEQDIEDAVSCYRDEADPKMTLAFVDALEAATAELCAHPHIGTLRFAFELEIPHLRSWSLQRFPYLVFYVPDADHIDIWRLLHTRRDIPEFLLT